MQRWAEILSRTLKNHMLEAETKKLTALTNEMEEIRLRGSAAAVVRVPNPNSTPNTNFKPTPNTRYWTAKDTSVNIAGLESKLDKLFELFVKYLSAKGITIEPGYFTITDGFRSIEKQLYYILDEALHRKEKKMYQSYIDKHRDIFNDILKNRPYIGSNAAGAENNAVIKNLKEKLEKKLGNDADIIKEMVDGYELHHVVAGATDVSIKDSKGCAKMLNDSAFKSQTEVKNIVKSIDIHTVGTGVRHVHIIFL